MGKDFGFKLLVNDFQKVCYVPYPVAVNNFCKLITNVNSRG